MRLTKLQIEMGGALAVAGVISFGIQAQANARLRGEIIALQHESHGVARLRIDNARLERTIAEADALRGDDAELEKIREEALGLKVRLQKTAEAASAQAAVAAPVYTVEQVDRKPWLKFQARPRYPAEMRRTGTVGSVKVELTVDAAGATRDVVAVASTGRPFEAAAVEAVRKWKYRPAMKDGLPVSIRMQVPIVFRLEGRSSLDPKRGPEGKAAAPIEVQPEWL